MKKVETEIYAFIPCHNRCETTLGFIHHLKEEVQSPYNLTIHVIDDGSTDNTGIRVKSLYPECFIHYLDGKAFWGGSLNYILDFTRRHICDGENPLILIANDDTRFKRFSLTNGINIISSGVTDILVPVMVDMTSENWEQKENDKKSLDELCISSGINVNQGDIYCPHQNTFTRRSSPGQTNLGITAALLLKYNNFKKAKRVPVGIPHYGSDFWLTYSLHSQNINMTTSPEYVIFRRQESTRPSSRDQGRWKYWQHCCRPSSPDYLPSSIIFEARFSVCKLKSIRLIILALKFVLFSVLTNPKRHQASLEITWPALIWQLAKMERLCENPIQPASIKEI